MWIRRLAIAIVTGGLLGLAAIAGSASADPLPTPWVVQLTLQATPDRVEVSEVAVAPCGAPDHAKGGQDLVALVTDETGGLISKVEMPEIRMMFIEPPEKGIAYEGPAFTKVGDRLLVNELTRVLRLSLGEGDAPRLPAQVALTDASGEMLFEVGIGPEHQVPADALGCQLPVLPEGPQEFEFFRVEDRG
ncbi:MAG: hypothetical protein ACQGVK_03935 [Myxococcota bacterium]